MEKQICVNYLETKKERKLLDTLNWKHRNK